LSTRRAAALGFPFAHLTYSPAGYSAALLSSAPITLAFEESGARFERVLLAADSHGVRWVVAHLDGHNAYNRLREARWAAELGRRYSAVGLPVAWLLDANGASPLDAACHALDGWPHWLRNASSSPRLVRQFGRAGAAQLDYRAVGALLQRGRGGTPLAAGANASARASADTTAGSFWDAAHPAGLHPRARPGGDASTCARVGRNHGGGPAAGAVFAAAPHPPVRTTFVLVNDAFAARWAPPQPAGGAAGAAAGCATLDSPVIRAASSYAPLACAWVAAP
jgi:hypothetical protein